MLSPGISYACLALRFTVITSPSCFSTVGTIVKSSFLLGSPSRLANVKLDANFPSGKNLFISFAKRNPYFSASLQSRLMALTPSSGAELCAPFPLNETVFSPSLYSA